MTSWAIWGLMLLLAGATYSMRAGLLLGFTRPLPPAMQQALRFVPPAVLAALVAPALVRLGSTVSLARLLAGLTGVLVATLTATHPTWRDKSLLLTVVSGMGVLWLLTWVGL